MNEKEDQLLNYIIEYYKKNRLMPSMRYLQKIMNYKSVNSITQHFKSLEKQSYLVRNNNNKLILSNYINDNNFDIKNIKVININNLFIPRILNKNKKYLGYQIKNNYFKNLGIYKTDTLIIEETNKLKSNDLGLFIIDKKYRIMKYEYKNGFYILSDKEELILNKIKIIGKVILVEKKL